MNRKVNCIIVDDEPMAREILVTYITRITNLNLIKSCSSAIEALNLINDKNIDLLFLDINMPEISGLSLAKSTHKKTKIIFTTAYREYAADGFDLQAIDYLLKPIAFDRFLQAVNKFLEIPSTLKNHPIENKSFTNNNFIFVRVDRKMLKIDFDSILYIESLSDYIKIHTKNKTIVTRETITNIQTKLPTTSFLRIHRSFIISISSINSYTNEYIEINKKAIPISRSYKEEVLNKLNSI
ncbi:DNA-binding response regulator [Tenacibaculum sp. E3R01]|uniref:LytR/AlgR family response regulator transcription factor n=1 Tax=unclassified Tenacibaculum TaxID=2635139 RepID=UPI000894EDC9|nr:MULTISPECIES: response regulator transcription factor [unclassified Tenacibaculum]RBW56984.1 DNA-binding response regulator [Tenacibaculum sp. E3R01]SED42587.1 DNA-binding response regulator, LytR/AlgR family [Tenacibaculum sp. MAR_2010_89]